MADSARPGITGPDISGRIFENDVPVLVIHLIDPYRVDVKGHVRTITNISLVCRSIPPYLPPPPVGCRYEASPGLVSTFFAEREGLLLRDAPIVKFDLKRMVVVDFSAASDAGSVYLITATALP